jgi:hypothetical protein
MTTANRAQYRQNLKRLKRALGGTFKKQPTTQAAYVVGDGHIKIDGQYYDATTTGMAGSAASVVNIGRPSAAVYATEGGGGSSGSGGGGSSGSGGGVGDLDEDDLLFRDGRNSLTGSLSVAAGALIDGVDLSEFYAAYGVHVLNPNAHHNRSHSITSTSDHTITAAQYSVVGATGPNTLGVLPTTTNGQSSPNTILRADASGDLALRNLNAATVNATTKLRAPLIDSASGDLTIAPFDDLILSPFDDLILSPFDDLILSPNVDVIMDTGTRIGTGNFVSGMVGWRVDYDGTGDFRKLFADELTVEVFISDVNLALAGSQFVAKSLGIVSKNFTIPSTNAALDIFDLPGFNDAQNFEDGDWVRLRFVERGTGLEVGDAWGTVYFYTDLPDGKQRWYWARSSGTVGKTINAGMVAIDYGQSGDGYIHLTSLQSNSPYLDVVTWHTDPSNHANHDVRVRLGKLDGITDTDLNPEGFGLYSDNTFLKGKFVAGNGDVVIDNGYGINVSAFTNTHSTTDFGKQIGFYLDPQSPSIASNVASLYGIRRTTGGGTTYNEGHFLTNAGGATGVDIASIDLVASGVSPYGLARILLTADTESGDSEISLVAQNTSGGDGRILLNGNVEIVGTLQPFSTAPTDVDIGTAGNPFRKIYADELVVSTVTGGGTSLTGNLWQYDAGDMYIRSNNAAARTLYVANPGGGAMSLDVEANITVGGTVDGVDLAALSSAYTSHAANPNAHHAKQHVLATNTGLGADHTISGAAAGYVLRASSSSAAAFARLSHADLDATSLVTGNPHSQYLRKATADTIGAIHTFDTGGAPFIIGATSAGELVAGLNANQLQGYGAGHFALAGHNHDDRYYTEAEADARFVQGTGGTIGGHTIWHSGNDGAGSGLDADTIHGLDLDDLDTRYGGNFLALTGGTLTGDLIIDGDAAGLQACLALATGAGVGEQWRFTGWAHDFPAPSVRGDFGFSLWDGTTDNLVYTIDRTAKIVNFTTAPTVGGATMWHAGNDGATSGLDADLLHGAAGSSYLRKDAAGTVTVAHTIATTAGFGPPFILGSNNIGQKVVGLNAEFLDGMDSTAFAAAAHNHNDLYYLKVESDLRYAALIHNHSTLQTPFTFVNGGTDLITIANDGDLQSANYLSGQTGYQLTTSGDAEFRSVTARGNFTSSIFAYRQMSVTAGDLFVGPGARLRSNFNAASDTYMDIEDPPQGHATVFTVDSILRIKGLGYTVAGEDVALTSVIPDFLMIPDGILTSPAVNIYDNWFKVTSVEDMGTFYRYHVTHQFGNRCIYPVGSTVASYGLPADGRIVLTSDNAYGPYIDLFTSGASPWDGTTGNVRIGNLAGLGVIDGDEKGLAAGEDLSDPDSAYLIASNEQILLNNVKFLTRGDGKTKVRIEPDGRVYFGPDVSDTGLLNGRNGFYFDSNGLYIGNDESYIEWLPPDEFGFNGALSLHADILAAEGLVRVNSTEGFVSEVGPQGVFSYTIWNTGSNRAWGEFGAGLRNPGDLDEYDGAVFVRALWQGTPYHLDIPGIDDTEYPGDAYLVLQAATASKIDRAEIMLHGYVDTDSQERGEIEIEADITRVYSPLSIYDTLHVFAKATGSRALHVNEQGFLLLEDLPTDPTDLPRGAVWNDQGTLKIT